jgi:hypothetical protein
MGRGEYYRWNAKTVTADVLSFTVKDLTRLRFKPGDNHVMTWKSRGREIGSIGLDLGHGGITVHYTSTPQGGKTIPVRVTISFALTPCNFGGHRKWFHCGCGRRITRLFIKGQRVACRHCLNLAYSSQREDRLDRLNRKIEKKERVLGENQQRPKGMHWTTYQRKRLEVITLEEQKWETFEAEYARRFPCMNF